MRTIFIHAACRPALDVPELSAPYPMSSPDSAVPGPSPLAQSVTLDTLPKGYSGVIVELRAPEGQAVADHVERLMELGFLPGETVRIVARGFPAGEPVAVRIGQATFALRRFEAEWIRVRSPHRAEA